jgi:hypothetical protein
VPLFIDSGAVRKLCDFVTSQYKTVGPSSFVDYYCCEQDLLAKIASAATIPLLDGLVGQGIVRAHLLSFSCTSVHARTKLVPEALMAIENLFTLSITDCALQMQIVRDMKGANSLAQFVTIEVKGLCGQCLRYSLIGV